jgi:hypothetical protein
METMLGWVEEYKYSLWPAIFFIVLAVILFIVSKIVFYLLLFVIADILINLIKVKFSIIDIPFDPITFGSLAITYYFGGFYSMLLIPFAAFTQIAFGLFELRHVIKLVTLFLSISVISYMRDMPFYIIPIVYLFRYISDYVLEFIIFQKVSLSRIPIRLFNVIVCFFILKLFN